jgi:ERCC4-related helicase
MQHYESPSHLQRLALSRGPQMFTSVSQGLYCDRCDIYCEDDPTMQEHLGSYRHLENMGGPSIGSHVGAAAKWKLSGQLGAGTGLSGNFQPTQVPPPPPPMSRGIYGQATTQNYEHYGSDGTLEYQFDRYTGHGHCNICGIELTSQTHMEQHIEGRNHHKVLGRRKMAAMAPQMSASAMSSMNFQPTSTVMLGHNRAHTSYNMRGVPTKSPGNNESFFSDQRSPVGSESSGAAKSLCIPEGQDDVYRIEMINGETWFKCLVCDVKTNTLAVMQTHLVGTKHLKNVEKNKSNGVRKGMDEQKDVEGLTKMVGDLKITPDNPDNFTTELKDGTMWHICKVCDIRVNSEEQLQVHKTGAKHLKAVQQGGVKKPDQSATGGSESDDESVLASPKPNIEELEGSVWTKEMIVGQLWYTCLVCKVKMNTMDTLKVHMGGTKHMKNMKYFHYSKPQHIMTTDEASVSSTVEVQSEPAIKSENSGGCGDDGEGRKIAGMEGKGWHTEHNNGTLWYVCDVCNVRMNSEDILKVHQMGSKHMRNEQQWKLTHGIDMGGLDGNNYDMGDTSMRKTWRKEQGPGGWWYVCEVCDVKMNTFEQLKIHQVGTKHMKNERRYQTLSLPNTDSMSENYKIEKAKVVSVKEEAKGSDEDMSTDETGVHETTLGSGRCGTGCFFHCPVCDIHCSGPVPRDQHLASAQHKKNIVKQGPKNKPRQSQYMERKIPEPDEFCDICEYSFTGRGALEAHLKTKAHQANSTSNENPNPTEDDTTVKKYITIEELEKGMSLTNLTRTKPRDYQVELCKKAMTKDCICFLPTGTGKTLVSAMVIRYMLELNPHRPVVFLVDRVLLVTQQSQVLQEEMGEIEIKRYDEVEKKYVTRKPRIASLCGGKQETDGLPLHQQDVIVVTAAYYLNLLEEGILKWSSNSLVVIDEAHHCEKEHPFNKLLYEYNAPLNTVMRPKILGLTASPAGKDTVPATEQMLLDLLDNVGDETRLIQVEEAMEELMDYQSTADMSVVEISSQWLAEHMCAMLLKVLHELLLWLAENTTLGQMNGVDTLFSGDPRSNDGGLNLDARKVEELMSHLPQIQCVRSTAVVLVHVKAIITMLLNVLMMVYTYGLPNAPEGLVYLKSMNDVRQLIQMSYGNHLLLRKLKYLACDYFMIREVLQRNSVSVDDQTTHQVAALQVIEQLAEKVDWLATAEQHPSRGDLTMALVLVKTRVDSVIMEEILEKSEVIKDKGLNACRIVGHGEGTLSGGMSVNQQNQILAAVKDKQYNIVVATSVAEEGLDLPSCEMVITLNPPTSVTALIQIRGRARRRASNFVLLCSTHKQMSELKQVLMREQNMIDAVKNVVNIQKEIEQRQSK